MGTDALKKFLESYKFLKKITMKNEFYTKKEEIKKDSSLYYTIADYE